MKKKIKILVADKINSSHFSLYKDFKFTFKEGITNKEILSYNDYFDVLLIRSIRKINSEFLDKCNFKIIATCSKGTDHIDLKSAKRNNVKIIYSPTGNTISAAEHTFGLILEIYKRIGFSDSTVRRGNFDNTNFPRFELRSKKIGIIGIGQVGSIVAKIANAFNMEIYANDIDKNVKDLHPELNFKGIKYIFKYSDIITIHIPLDKKNINFINEQKFNLMSRKSVFINTSRGGIIDEKYLLKILKQKRIYFAGLDVFQNEPGINKKFTELDNVVLTNHIAGKTFESYNNILKEILLQVKNAF